MQSMLVIMPLSGTAVAPSSLVQALFDVTPAEARVALALGEAASVDDAARRLGVSRETVRSHLRAIFSKTGVSRQSALVRSLAGLSPPGGLQRGRDTKASGARA
jgi:DNA-binding CsgD family transcriptional regulator